MEFLSDIGILHCFYSIEFPFVGAFVFSICFKTTVLWKLLNFLLATTSDKTGRGRLEKSPPFPCHPDQNNKMDELTFHLLLWKIGF